MWNFTEVCELDNIYWICGWTQHGTRQLYCCRLEGYYNVSVSDTNYCSGIL